jgi:hypothetical protein
MEFVKRESVSDKLNKYCYLAKDNAFIELTMWTNGEGYDISIDDQKTMSLTCGEIDAINHLRNCLEYKDK